MKQIFTNWYLNNFKPSELYNNMRDVKENSPYHREANVAIHTDMVVDEYFKIKNYNEWSLNDVIVGLALAFHDVGKPKSKEEVTRPDGSVYYRFGGHEKISANMWRDYLTKFTNEFDSLCPNPIQHLFYPVAWLIENHLPYSLKDKNKVNNIALTLKELYLRENFFDMLRADARGRISDDHFQKLQKVEDWITAFPQAIDNDEMLENKSLVVLIGPSGSGKSTYVENHKTATSATFSWDDLRLEYYTDPHIIMNPKEQYEYCFQLSTKDSKFQNRAFARFMEMIHNNSIDTIFLDNTNMSKKSRQQFVMTAKQHGWIIEYVIFVVSKDEINSRQLTRRDKYLHPGIIEQQYYNMSLPGYGEGHEITVVT